MSEAQLFIGVFLLLAAVCGLVVVWSGPVAAVDPNDDDFDDDPDEPTPLVVSDDPEAVAAR